MLLPVLSHHKGDLDVRSPCIKVAKVQVILTLNYVCRYLNVDILKICQFQSLAPNSLCIHFDVCSGVVELIGAGLMLLVCNCS
jgi:hypothetical protein